jgi:hypothetical protein
MTILESIVWNTLMLQLHKAAFVHAFLNEGVVFWCQKGSLHRVFDQAHHARLLGLRCFVSSVQGYAHPAG